MVRLSGILAWVLLMTACQQVSSPTVATIPIPTTSQAADIATTTTQAVTPDPTPAENDRSRCFDEAASFTDDGFLGRSDTEESDSQTLAGINWTDSSECAAVTLSFRTEPGAPAVDPPAFRAEYLRHTGIVRIELGPEIIDSALSDQAFDTALLAGAYVVYDPSLLTLMVDIHLAEGATARVRSASSPSRLVLEMERDDQTIEGTPVFGDAVVLLQPATRTPPMMIEGYGRAGLDLSASVVTSAGAFDRTLTFEGSPTRWTFFEWTIREFQPGPVAIRVGDAPPIEFISP